MVAPRFRGWRVLCVALLALAPPALLANGDGPGEGAGDAWRAPEEMPALDRFQKKVSDEQIEILAINRDSGGTDSTIEFYVKNQIRNLALYTDRMGLFAHEMKVGKVPVTIYANSESLEIKRIFGLLDWDSDNLIQHVRACLL